MGAPRHVVAERHETAEGIWLDLSHDGWLARDGLWHERRLFLSAAGELSPRSITVVVGHQAEELKVAVRQRSRPSTLGEEKISYEKGVATIRDMFVDLLAERPRAAGELARELELGMVIVTHNLQQAYRIADHVAFMYLGDLVEYNSATALFGSPREQRTREYVSGAFG